MMEWLANIRDFGVLVALAVTGVSLVVLAVLGFRRSAVYKSVEGAWRRAGVVGRSVFVVAVIIAAAEAQKSGTNDAPMMMSMPRPIVSTISEAEFSTGFAITRVGTNEVWNFAPGEGAVFAEKWLRRGAAVDVLEIENEELRTENFWKNTPLDNYPLSILNSQFTTNRIFASSTGIVGFNVPYSNPKVRPIPYTTTNSPLSTLNSPFYLAPFRAPLGIVPASNWEAAGVESRFWHEVTDEDALRLVWENVLYKRDADFPISFAADLFPNGDFTFYYDLAALTNATDWVTNVTVGAQFGTNGVQLIIDNGEWRVKNEDMDSYNSQFSILNSQLTSIHWRRLPTGAAADSDDDNDGLTTAEEIQIGTDPKLSDSDFDGIADGAEFALGLDPLDFDTDGDGLADGVDPQPAVNGGALFGQSAAWYRATYPTNLLAVAESESGEVALEWNFSEEPDGWYFVTVEAGEEGKVSLVAMGEQRVVITNIAELVFLARLGEQEIVATTRLGAVSASAADATVTRVGARCARVRRIPTLTVDAPCFGESDFATVSAALSPRFRGECYHWYGSGITPVSPDEQTTEVVWDRHIFVATLGCIATVGAFSVTNEMALYHSFCGAGPSSSDFVYVTVNGAERSASLMMDAYTNAPGEFVAATSTPVRVDCHYNGDKTALVTLSSTADDKFRLYAEISAGVAAEPETLPRQWTAQGAGHWRFWLEPVTNSVSVDDIELKFTASGISSSAKLTAVKIVSEADAWGTIPDNPQRHVFGPKEKINLSSVPQTYISWDFYGLHVSHDEDDERLKITMPAASSNLNIKASCNGAELQIPYQVIEPSPDCLFTNAMVMTEAHWYLLGVANPGEGIHEPLAGEVGVGMAIDIHLMPQYVSFRNIRVYETSVPAVNVTGYFADPTCPLFGNLDHNVINGSENHYKPEIENKFMTDNVLSTLGADTNWYAGGYQWNIEAFWYVDGGSVTNQLNWSPQVFNLDTNGNMSVSKFGWTAMRGTNDVSTIIRTTN